MKKIIVKMKKKLPFAVFLILTIFHTYSERIHDYGNSPTFGIQLNVLGGEGAAGNDTYGNGFGFLGDAGLRFDIKPINKIYLLDSKKGAEVYVRNTFGIFTFIKFNGTVGALSTDKTVDTDIIVGGGLHFEWPRITENFDDTFARSFFIEPLIGYDLNDKQVKLEVFPGIATGTGKMWKQLYFQMQIGFNLKFTLSEDYRDLLSKSYMLVVGCKFLHDFNHSKYYKLVEEYNNAKYAEESRQLQIQRNMQQEEDLRHQEENRRHEGQYRPSYATTKSLMAWEYAYLGRLPVVDIVALQYVYQQIYYSECQVIAAMMNINFDPDELGKYIDMFLAAAGSNSYGAVTYEQQVACVCLAFKSLEK